MILYYIILYYIILYYIILYYIILYYIILYYIILYYIILYYTVVNLASNFRIRWGCTAEHMSQALNTHFRIQYRTLLQFTLNNICNPSWGAPPCPPPSVNAPLELKYLLIYSKYRFNHHYHSKINI